MELSFTGTFDQKVDSKGRMSIPAGLRRVLEAGDPQFASTGLARMMVVYGPHLSGHLQAYTITEFNRIATKIRKMKRGSVEQRRTARLILGHSELAEVDRDGRVVLHRDRRAQIGLEGWVSYVGLGAYFEIWNKADTESAMDDIDSWLEDMGPDFDPLMLLPDDEPDGEDGG